MSLDDQYAIKELDAAAQYALNVMRLQPFMSARNYTSWVDDDAAVAAPLRLSLRAIIGQGGRRER